MTTKKTQKNAVEAVSAVSSSTSLPTTGLPTIGSSAGGFIGAVVSSGNLPGVSTVTAPTGLRAQLQNLLQGFQTAIPAGSTLPSSSGGYPQASVVTQLQQYMELYTTVSQQDLGLKASRAQLEAAVPTAREYFNMLKAALQGYYGPANPQLAQFGIAPRKARAKPSTVVLAASAVKAKASRSSRGTQKQKQALKVAAAAAVVAGASTSQPVSAPAPVAAPAVAAVPSPVSVPKSS